MQCNGSLVSHFDVDVDGIMTEQVRAQKLCLCGPFVHRPCAGGHYRPRASQFAVRGCFWPTAEQGLRDPRAGAQRDWAFVMEPVRSHHPSLQDCARTHSACGLQRGASANNVVAGGFGHPGLYFPREGRLQGCVQGAPGMVHSCAHVSGLSDWFTAGFQDAMGAHERADYGYTRGVPREVWAGFEGSAQQVYVRPIPVAHPDGGGQASCGVWAAVRPNRWRLQAIQNPDTYAGKPPPPPLPPPTHRHSVAATSHNRHALAS